MTYINYPGGPPYYGPNTWNVPKIPPLDVKEGGRISSLRDWLEGYLEGKTSLTEEEVNKIREKFLSNNPTSTSVTITSGSTTALL